MSSENEVVSKKVWVRTRKCGCGNCAFLPISHICPRESAKDAIWLWARRNEKNESNQSDK